MSALKIWPVVGSTRRGTLGKGRVSRDDPPDRAVANIARIPVSVVGLLLHLDRIDEPRPFERLVPGQDALANRRAVLHRNGVLQPEHDRLLRPRDDGSRVGLLEMPAIDVAHGGREGNVGAVVLPLREEVAHTVVGQTRTVSGLRELCDAVAKPHEQAAHIDERARARRRRRRRAARRDQRRHGRAIDGVVRDRLDLRVALEAAELAECRVLRVEAVGNPVRRLERVAEHRKIRQQNRPEVDQQALALGMRQALDFRRPENRVAERLLDGTAQRRVVHGDVGGVLPDHLHQGPLLVEDDGDRAAHGRRVEAPLAQPGLARQLEHIHAFELIGLELEPHLLRRAIHREQSARDLGILHDLRKRLLLRWLRFLGGLVFLRRVVRLLRRLVRRFRLGRLRTRRG